MKKFCSSKIKLFYMLPVVFIPAIFIIITACGGGGSDNKSTSPPPPSVTFENATTPGQTVSVTVGSTTFTMVYANNQTSITFPFCPLGNNAVDTSAATLTKKFFLSETLVTNALCKEVFQWALNNGKIAETGGAHNEVNATTVMYGGKQLLDLDEALCKISYNTATNTFSVASGYESHPVIDISWHGAIMFCNWLTEMRDGNTNNLVYTGIDSNWTHDETVEDAAKTGYRLPSSEEWEYTARYIGTTAPTSANLSTEYVATNVRGGEATLTVGYYWTPAIYASGAIKNTTNATETRAVAWYSGDPGMGGSNILMPVSQKTANQLGIKDICGNVWKWCFTLDGLNSRVLRGGSFTDNNTAMQVGRWVSDSPLIVSPSIGFHFVRTQ